MNRSFASRLVRAWLLTAVIDGSFSGILAQFFYGSTAKRLFQGVAAVLLGPDAVNGCTRTVLIGIAKHFGVALAWSTVFLFIFTASARVREIVGSRGGALKVAAIYGPFIWCVMSLALIPLLTHRPPAITYRWWIQFFGHIPFVALPIVSMIGSGQARQR